MSDCLLDEIIRLRREGLSFWQIGPKLGIKPQTAAKLVRDEADARFRREREERKRNLPPYARVG
jgi:hypothetical protein